MIINTEEITEKKLKKSTKTQIKEILNSETFDPRSRPFLIKSRKMNKIYYVLNYFHIVI
jgi:hypothetical protein